MQTAQNAQTTDALIAAHIATKGVTQCPPANAVPPSPQSSPVVSAKTAERVKKAIAKTDAKPAKKTATKKADVKAKPAKTPTVRATVNPGKTSLASIVAELGINAKSARSILRRHMTKPEGGWTFDANAAKKVRALLTPKA